MSAMSAMSVSVNSFASSIEEALSFFKDAPKAPKQCSYGSLIYKPAVCVVEFGKETWPSPYIKKEVCPRILLISNWTDNRYVN
jgi:hypothetical protein